MAIRTYTATLIIPAGSTAGTVQFGAMPNNAFQTANTSQGVPCNGRLYAVQIAFGGGTAGTLTVKTKGQGGPQQTLLNLANVNTDSWFYPRIQSQNSSGVNLGTTVVDQYPIDDAVEFGISGGGTAGTYTARMLTFQ